MSSISTASKSKFKKTMRSLLILLLLLLVAVVAVVASSSPTKFTVGDEKGWNPGVNYTIWTNKHKPFHVGDWLVFYYQSGTADVVQVDETAFEKCDASHPIRNYSKGRSYAFELNETKHYYFICSYGYCYQGMKLAVNVQHLPPPSPPPANPSPAPRAVGSVLAAAAAGVLAAVFSRLV